MPAPSWNACTKITCTGSAFSMTSSRSEVLVTPPGRPFALDLDGPVIVCASAVDLLRDFAGQNVVERVRALLVRPLQLRLPEISPRRFASRC